MLNIFHLMQCSLTISSLIRYITKMHEEESNSFVGVHVIESRFRTLYAKNIVLA